ncbi:MAG: rsmI [Bacteroidetes bacterium]|jgi:16S rRNA (cytidine1402-2'-O)-methyltransferase|nr:rsmI [Bacteroidota bacterium]
MAKLVLVPTPIGNLEDITLRALRLLKECDLILAEDTRTTSYLLKHFEISKPLRSYHQHNEHKILEDLIAELKQGKKIILVSDAGTPAVSDPGFLLVRECLRNGVEVETLPGATAFVPALVNSGFPCNEFVFMGFLPQKKGRHTKWQQLKKEERTFILYESPFRLVKLLEEIKENLGAQRMVSVSRELSKMFEENKRGPAEEVLEHFKKKTVKGEIVVVVEGNPDNLPEGRQSTETDEEEA